jgi:hypothetical protein
MSTCGSCCQPQISNENDTCMSAPSSAECGRELCCEAAAACCGLEAAGGSGRTPVSAAPLKLQVARAVATSPEATDSVFAAAAENTTTVRTRAVTTMPVSMCTIRAAGARQDAGMAKCSAAARSRCVCRRRSVAAAVSVARTALMLIVTKEALCSRMSAWHSLRESKGDGLGAAGGGGAELQLARSRRRCLGLRSSHLCFNPASWRSTPEAGLGAGRGVSYLFPQAGAG